MARKPRQSVVKRNVKSSDNVKSSLSKHKKSPKKISSMKHVAIKTPYVNHENAEENGSESDYEVKDVITADGVINAEVCSNDESMNEYEEDIEMEGDEAPSDVEDHGSELNTDNKISADRKEVGTKAIVDTEKDEKLPPKLHINTVFVRNLPELIDKQTLQKHFSKAGEVIGTRIFIRPNKSRNYCFVQMVDQLSYQRALSLHNSTLGGKQIIVEVADQDWKIRRPGHVLLVNNLPDSIDKSTLQEHFGKAGEITRINILSKSKTDTSSAYVTMADAEKCERALLLHHSMIGGQQINVTKHTRVNHKKRAEIVTDGSSKKKADAMKLKQKGNKKEKTYVKPKYFKADLMQEMCKEICKAICKNMPKLTNPKQPKISNRSKLTKL